MIQSRHDSKFGCPNRISSACDNQDIARQTAMGLSGHQNAPQAQKTMNEYLLKKLANDPQNHVTQADLVKGYAGKSKGDLINWLSSKASDAIQKQLVNGSKELESMKKTRDTGVGNAVKSIEEQAEEADLEF